LLALHQREVVVFDLDAFLAACDAAVGESEPRLAIREVLEAAVSQPDAVAAALPPMRAEIVALHTSPRLTVLKVVWAPAMSLGAHDHRMWAAIGVYSGGEDNQFFRRDGETLASTGGQELRPGDVCLLGKSAVHAVTNPTTDYAGAIHVYGGDFFATPRSEWRGEPPREEPYDVDRVLALFAAANERQPSS
jgi:predicted metal-dependent enzyme (double-stranded beta helix superfamily)